MGTKLYSASRFTKIKKIIYKTCNNFLISVQTNIFSQEVDCQNKGQVTNNKNACCFIKGILKYKLKYRPNI